TESVNVVNNILEDNDTGVTVLESGPYTTDISEINVIGNSITGDGLAIDNQSATSTELNATGNWFGTADPAEIAAKTTGNVNASPALASGADGSEDAGFQGNTSSIVVLENDSLQA